MATTTPQGWRRVKPILSCPVPRLASRGRLSPYSWVPSNAASRIRSPERDASPLASVMVLPHSPLISRAVSSARSSASSAARSRTRMRSWAGVRRHRSAPAWAAARAASTSSTVATGTVPTTAPSNGEVTSSTASRAAAGRHRPPMSISMGATPTLRLPKVRSRCWNVPTPRSMRVRREGVKGPVRPMPTPAARPPPAAPGGRCRPSGWRPGRWPGRRGRPGRWGRGGAGAGAVHELGQLGGVGVVEQVDVAPPGVAGHALGAVEGRGRAGAGRRR